MPAGVRRLRNRAFVMLGGDRMCWHRPCLNRVALIFPGRRRRGCSKEKLVIPNPASDASAVGLHDPVHNLMVQIELHTKERGKENHMFKRVGMLFLVFVLGTVGAFAQQETGQISGKVVDPNGAAVAKAAVTVKSVGTSAQRDTTTDDSGNYILTNLQPGLYDVTVKSSGFA